MLWFLRWLMNPFWVLFGDRAEAARQATLLWTLAAAVEKQFPAVPLLEALADEAGGSWGLKVRGLADLISAGVSVPGALESSGALSADAMALVRVGSETGNLLSALNAAAELARHRTEAPVFKFQGAMVYACLLVMVITGITTFVAIYVIPKYKVIFEGFAIELPASTEAFIAITDGIGRFFPLLVPLFLLLVWIVLSVSLDLFGWGSGWGQPSKLASRFWPRLRAPHVLRCLGVAVEAGTPLSTTLAAMVGHHSDKLLRQRLAPVAGAVEAGDDCWQSLRGAGFLRWSETALLSAAQRAGNLDWALLGVADTIERRLDFRYRTLLEFVQPAMIAALGGLVAGFCLSLFLPIVSLLEKLS